MIAFGGGMAGAGAFLLNPIRRHFKRKSWRISKLRVKLALAKLGNDAGLIGAAGLAKHAHRSEFTR
jgi:glucokinase